MRLRRPRNEGGAGGGTYGGHRVFTVTQRPFDEYVNTFGTVGKVCGAGCAAFVAVGAGMVLVKVARARMVRWRERRFRRRLAAAEKARREAAAAAGSVAGAAGGAAGGTAGSAGAGAGAAGAGAAGAAAGTAGSGSLWAGFGTSVSSLELASGNPPAAASADDDGLPPTRRPGETCVVCLFEEACVCYKECGHLVRGDGGCWRGDIQA